MNDSKSISIKDTIRIIIALLLMTTLALSTGCNTGGTNLRLHGVSLGTVTTDGKTVVGLPSEKVDLLLKVSVKEIRVDYSANGSTVLTLGPSGATLEISPSGIVINGIKPEQIKVVWSVSQQD